MKFSILFLFWFASIFAQQQFRTSDFGYSDDVVKVEESLYKFDKILNKFVKENYYITEIKNTYVQRQILENIYQEEKISGEYLYVYNSDLTLKEINYKPIIGNFGHPIRFLFNYEKGKLKKVIVEDMSSTTYEYDKKGNLIKEVELNADDEPSETIFYQDYNDKKSYTKIKKSNDGSGNDFTKEIYKDGLLIEKNMISEDFKSNTKYSYDNFRNVISQVYDDSSRIDFNYEFDAKNNRIKIAKLIPEINEEIKGLYNQWDEIIIKKAIPKEIGEELMLQALDTTRNARPSQMKEKMEISNHIKKVGFE